MAMAAIPLLEMAGTAAAPMIEDLIGAEMLQKISPLAKKALSHVIKSKAVHKGLKKIGNKFFGKHHKTARGLLKKGQKIAGVLGGKQAHKLIKGGLNVGASLGMLDQDQADNIMGGYNKALSLHDQLSNFNKKHVGLTPKVNLGALPDIEELAEEVAEEEPQRKNNKKYGKKSDEVSDLWDLIDDLRDDLRQK